MERFDRLFAYFINSFDQLFYEFSRFFAHFAIDLPLAAWWLPLIILLILGATALIDARTGHIPDQPLFFGLLLSIAAHGFYNDWPPASQRLLLGIIAAFVLWGINQIYFRLRKHDAIGMGDAKWTALAVVTFGIKPALFAWVIGAWLGIFWMAASWLVRWAWKMPRKDHIHFAPFLFLGLSAGLYWIYLR